MIRRALIVNGKVTNVAVFSDDASFAEGWVDCQDEVGINWTVVGGQFVAPPVVPKPVEPPDERITIDELIDELEITSPGLRQRLLNKRR